MIDFRYHVVSLVAVFIALSVGMVIGGFALRGPVADQLNQQVSQLSNDKAALRAQLGAATDGAKSRDSFDEAVSGQLIAGALTDRSVAIVALPGTDKSLVSTTTKTLRSAGATVASTTTLSDGWATADNSVDFTALGKRIGVKTADAGSSRLPGVVLAKALMAPGGPGLDTLSQAGLTSTSDNPQDATAVVVLWGDLPSGAKTSAWTDIVAGLGAGAGVGIAGAAGHTDSTKSDPLMSAIRDTPDVATHMSTVDDVAIPMGQVALALALADEYKGISGQYGTASDATAVLPTR